MWSWLTLAFVVAAGFHGPVARSDNPPVVGGFPEQAQPLPPQYDVPPKAIRVTRPEMPLGFAELTATKTVLVRMLIDTRGRVVKATVTKSVPGLDAAALDCVKSWRFRPALKDGQPIAALAEGAVTFNARPTTDKI
jgi:TonB family protein